MRRVVEVDEDGDDNGNLKDEGKANVTMNSQSPKIGSLSCYLEVSNKSSESWTIRTIEEKSRSIASTFLTIFSVVDGVTPWLGFRGRVDDFQADMYQRASEEESTGSRKTFCEKQAKGFMQQRFPVLSS
jgi:hypothetical protein